MVRLFGLARAIVYKKKSGRSWDRCRAGLRSYLDGLKALSTPALTLDVPLMLVEEKGAAAFKRVEDQPDAVLCAYVAGLAWLFSAQRLEMIGTISDGYLVLPRARVPGSSGRINGGLPDE
jgi:predicted RNase H-like nuclease